MPSIRKNYLLSLAYEILAFAVPLITAPYLSRVLGPSGMGAYSYTYNIAYYFGMFSAMGMLRYGTRSIAAARSSQGTIDKLFWELFAAQFLTASVVIAAYIIYMLSVGDVLAKVWLLYIVSTAMDITWLFRGEEDFKVTVVRNSVVKVGSAVLIFVLVKTSNDVWLYAGIMSLGYLISQAVLWPYLKKHVKSFVLPVWVSVRRHLLPNALLFVPLVATSVYRVFDKIMIGALSSQAELGYFDCADKIIMVPLGIISALGAVMLPRMAHLISNGNEKQGVGYLRITMTLSMIISSCLMFSLIAVGDLFAVVYFGEDYSQTGFLLVLLSVTVPMIAWASVLREQYLIPKKMDRQYIVSVIAGAFVNLTLNWLIVPRYGSSGAACVTIFTELLVCMMLTFAVRKMLPIGLYFRDAVPYFLIGIVMLGGIKGLSVLLSASGIFLLMAQIIAGLVIYFIMLTVLSKVSSSHGMLLKSLVSRN